MVSELLRGERTAKKEQECEQSAEDVESVEACGQEEYGSEWVVRDGQAVGHELCVFEDLECDEDATHDEGQSDPLVHAPLGDLEERARTHWLEALRRLDACLADEGRGNQDERVHGGERHVQVAYALAPLLSRNRGTDGEVHREETREEHEFAREPHDGSNRHWVRTVHSYVMLCFWRSSYSRHKVNYG